MIFSPPHPDPPPGATKVTYDNRPYVVEWKIPTGRWHGHWAWCVISPSSRRCFVVVAKGGPRPKVRP